MLAKVFVFHVHELLVHVPVGGGEKHEGLYPFLLGPLDGVLQPLMDLIKVSFRASLD